MQYTTFSFKDLSEKMKGRVRVEIYVFQKLPSTLTTSENCSVTHTRKHCVENEILDKLNEEGNRKLVRVFSLSYCYIDDLISFNDERF